MRYASQIKPISYLKANAAEILALGNQEVAARLKSKRVSG